MNRTVQTGLFKSVMPALALGAVLMVLDPTAALAQHGGGERGGHSGGSFSAVRSQAGVDVALLLRPTRAVAIRAVGIAMPSYAAPYAGRSYSGGHSYYGGRFWSRPYFGIRDRHPIRLGLRLGFGLWLL